MSLGSLFRGGHYKLAVCLGFLVIAVGACSSSQPGTASSASASKSPLVVDLAGGTGTLDPAEACDVPTVDFVGQFYARLTQYGSMPGPGGTTEVDPSVIKPWFAQSWQVSDGGRIYTFSLHPGAKFPNGDPMDAAAVKYSLDRSIAMAGCGQYYILDGIYGPNLVKSIAAPSATTVVITLNQADSNFLQCLAQPAAGIVDPKMVQAHGGVQANKVNSWMAGHVAGSGPFLLSQFNAGVSAVLTPNPAYFGPPPASNKILVNFISDDATLLLKAESGEADVTVGLSYQSAHNLSGNACCRLIDDPTPNTLEIDMPPNGGPGNGNVKFREALTYAVPYQQIMARVAYGYGKLFYGPYPPIMPQFDASLEAPPAYDIAKATQLLASSGLKLPVKVTMMINGAIPLDQQIATIVQSTWRQIGVDVSISQLPEATYDTRLNNRQYDMAVAEDGPGVINAGYYLGYDMVCGQAFNLGGICVPGADKLLTEARSDANSASQLSTYRAIIPLWTAQSPRIDVFALDAVTVLGPRVGSFFYSHEMDMRTWSLR